MHGQAKLVRGPEGFAVVLHTLGVPLPQLLAWLTTFVELIGGVAVLAGAFLPLVSIPLAIVLLTARSRSIFPTDSIRSDTPTPSSPNG